MILDDLNAQEHCSPHEYWNSSVSLSLPQFYRNTAYENQPSLPLRHNPTSTDAPLFSSSECLSPVQPTSLLPLPQNFLFFHSSQDPIPPLS